jgi:hypothetical protein
MCLLWKENKPPFYFCCLARKRMTLSPQALLAPVKSVQARNSWIKDDSKLYLRSRQSLRDEAPPALEQLA